MDTPGASFASAMVHLATSYLLSYLNVNYFILQDDSSHGTDIFAELAGVPRGIAGNQIVAGPPLSFVLASVNGSAPLCSCCMLLSFMWLKFLWVADFVVAGFFQFRGWQPHRTGHSRSEHIQINNPLSRANLEPENESFVESYPPFRWMLSFTSGRLLFSPRPLTKGPSTFNFRRHKSIMQNKDLNASNDSIMSEDAFPSILIFSIQLNRINVELLL